MRASSPLANHSSSVVRADLRETRAEAVVRRRQVLGVEDGEGAVTIELSEQEDAAVARAELAELALGEIAVLGGQEHVGPRALAGPRLATRGERCRTGGPVALERRAQRCRRLDVVELEREDAGLRRRIGAGPALRLGALRRRQHEDPAQALVVTCLTVGTGDHELTGLGHARHVREVPGEGLLVLLRGEQSALRAGLDEDERVGGHGGSVRDAGGSRG
jgi:hypothetical protein